MDPKLLIRINGDASGFEKAARSAADEGTRLAGIVSKIGQFSVAGLGLAALPLFIKNTADGIDALNDLSDVTGSTVEKLSSLEDTALRTGNSFESVQTTLVRFNKTLKDADGKDRVSQALREIGLSVQELKKLDPVDALVEVAQALERFGDGPDKARLIMELTGKSAAEAAPLLKDLADKGLSVATVTTDQAKAAEQYNKELAELSKNSTDLARSLTSALIPSLNEVLKGYREGGLRGGLDALGEVIGLGKAYYAQRGIGQLTEDIDKLQSRLKLAGSFGVTEYSKSLQAELDGKVTELKKLQDVLQKTQQAGARGRRPLNEGGGGYNPPKIDFKPVDAGKKPRTAEEQARLDEASYKALDEADKRHFDSLEKFIERDIALEERRTAADRKEQSKRLDDAVTFGIQLQDQTESLTASLITDERARGEALIEIDRKRMSEQIDALGVSHNIELQLYDALNANIVARQAQLNEALKPQYQRQLDLFADTLKYMEQFNDNFLSGFIDSGRDAFTQWAMSGKLSTRNLTDFIKSSFARLAYDRFLAQATSNLGSTILDGLVRAVGSLSGGGQGSNPNGFDGTLNNPSAYVATPMATGTNRVPYDGFLASLHKDEAVVPARYNPAVGGAGGGQVIKIGEGQVINVGQGVSRGEVLSAVRQANAELEQKLYRSKNRGGQFA